MIKCTAVPLALGAAFAALLCLARRRQPDQFCDAEIRTQLRQIHDDLLVQRRLSVHAQRVLNDAHHLIHGVTKTLEKQPS